jgi:hypothetical protein
MSTIHAYTELTGESYPGYVNLSEQPGVAGACSLTVRERGHNGMKQATLSLSREQALRLANDILAKLDVRRG